MTFMHSPDRSIADYDVNSFYSPTAGYISRISQSEDKTRITYFLNVFDNHTQYLPIASNIVSQTRFRGGYVPAYEQHSLNNERVEHVLYSEKHGFEYKIYQITGMLTRRILVMAKPGELYKTGDRLGFILFGSRVDVEIPTKNISRLLVSQGDHVSEMQKIIELNN
jgi:phosphatidylserine decarboxylase